MKSYFSRAGIAICLWLVVVSATAQSPGQAPKLIVYSTPPKLATAKVNTGNATENSGYSIRGKAILTITAANDNDTITGILTFLLPENARQKMAQVSGKPLSAIPAYIIKRDVVAAFEPGTGCPVVHIETRRIELEIAGMKATINRLLLDITETPDQIPQLFCSWTRQINAKRQRRGIIAAINRLISPEQ